MTIDQTGRSATGQPSVADEVLRRICAALAEHVWNGTPDGGVRGYVDTIDAAAFLDVLARHDLTIEGVGGKTPDLADQPGRAPEPGTGELGTWKPEVVRAVEALREFDWTGFDPTSLDHLAELAAAVVNESGATFADVLPPSTD